MGITYMDTSKRERKVHTCSFCKYQTLYTTCMKTHLQRINACGTLDDPEFKRMYEHYVERKTKDAQCECELCGAKFTCKRSIYKHRKTCRGMVKLEVEVQQLRKELQEIKEKAVINISIQNTQTIHNTVNVFGEESLGHLNQEIIDRCFSRRKLGHVDLVKQIYNSKKNRNVKPALNKPNCLLTFNGETHVYQMKDDVYDKMIDKSFDILTSHYEQHGDRLKKSISPSLMNDIMAHLEKVYDKDLDTLIWLRHNIGNAFSQAFLKWHGCSPS